VVCKLNSNALLQVPAQTSVKKRAAELMATLNRERELERKTEMQIIDGKINQVKTAVEEHQKRLSQLQYDSNKSEERNMEMALFTKLNVTLNRLEKAKMKEEKKWKAVKNRENADEGTFPPDCFSSSVSFFCLSC
jgi:hypothetical protein